jgi:hypothetical protein
MEIQTEIENLATAKKDEAIRFKIKQFSICTLRDESTVRKRAGLYGISVITVALYQRVMHSILTTFRVPLNTWNFWLTPLPNPLGTKILRSSKQLVMQFSTL